MQTAFPILAGSRDWCGILTIPKSRELADALSKATSGPWPTGGDARTCRKSGAINHCTIPDFFSAAIICFASQPCVKREAYDESMRTNGEDTDISRRLRDKGWDLLYDPEPRVVHLRHDTTRSILDTYWRWWRFGVRAYANGVRLRSVLGHAVFVHFRHTFLDLVRSDLDARRFDLLGLDLAALGYFPYRDFRLWLAAHPKPPSQRVSSEV